MHSYTRVDSEMRLFFVETCECTITERIFKGAFRALDMPHQDS